MRRSSHRIKGLCLFGAATVLASGSCATMSGDPYAQPDREDAVDGVWSPDEILRAEIDTRGEADNTAMALIRRLRPGWLRARGQKSIADPGAAYPIVYIDEVRRGGLATLDQIPASEIFSLQFFSTSDATTRWGTGHPSGVINVVTGRF